MSLIIFVFAALLAALAAAYVRQRHGPVAALASAFGILFFAGIVFFLLVASHIG